MHDLQLVGVHNDGEHLVLTGGDGQRYRVRIDEPLRAAVRRDRARLGQLQIQTEGGLRPKEIQARIRAGETAETVAERSGLPLEHVRRYEGPVLAERQHVAVLARRLPARQVPDRPPFDDLVSERLTARGVAADAATWDAWRREGSTWTVQLSFRAGSKDRVAQWTFDVQRSHLEPLDDEARWLSAPVGAERPPAPARRLATVSERVYDVEADGGVRAADVPADDADGARTLDLLDALRGRRGRRHPLDAPGEMTAGPAAGTGTAVEDAEPDIPPAAHPAASTPAEAVDAEVLALPEEVPPVDRHVPVEEAVEDHIAEEQVAEDLPDTDTGTASGVQPPPKPRKPSRSSKSRRASVPSWDDIVFGAKRE